MHIPKCDGSTRPLGIAALEDKLLQQAVRMVLEPIYEAQLLGFSYGFRPGRSPHGALDAFAVAVGQKVNWVLDADIRAYFDSIEHEWMQRFLEHRIGDRQIVETKDRQLITTLHTMLVECGCPHPALIDGCARGNDAGQLWVLETLLSLEPGSSFRSWFGPTRHTWAETRRVDFDMPALPGHETPAEMVRVLNRRLLEKRAGGASVVGNGRHDGIAWATVSVSLSGAFDPSFARLIRLLRALRAPEDTQLSWWDPELRRATLREVIAAVS